MKEKTRRATRNETKCVEPQLHSTVACPSVKVNGTVLLVVQLHARPALSRRPVIIPHPLSLAARSPLRYLGARRSNLGTFSRVAVADFPPLLRPQHPPLRDTWFLSTPTSIHHLQSHTAASLYQPFTAHWGYTACLSRAALTQGTLATPEGRDGKMGDVSNTRLYLGNLPRTGTHHFHWLHLAG